MNGPMTSLQRVFTTLGHQEPDRVPLFLFPTMHGAKELGLSIEEYFAKAENVKEGQLRIRKKYNNDCLSNFFYGPLEVEAWGGEVIFSEDGPPNSGAPFIRSPQDIKNLQIPKIEETACLQKVLETTRLLKAAVGDDAPIIGVVISPLSLPIMQMGFDKYIELIYQQPQLFDQLININESFCVDWANAQLAAGVTAICYFDPFSSTTIIPREMYLKNSFPVAKRTLAQIKGATATHMGSGRCLPILNDISLTGTTAVGVSVEDNLAEVKAVCKNKLAVIGNLNGLEMRRWTPEYAELMVKEAIAKAGPGGGFILSDNHGEIPWQVPDEIITAISEALQIWGRYPLNWVEDYA